MNKFHLTFNINMIRVPSSLNACEYQQLLIQASPNESCRLSIMEEIIGFSLFLAMTWPWLHTKHDGIIESKLALWAPEQCHKIYCPNWNIHCNHLNSIIDKFIYESVLDQSILNSCIKRVAINWWHSLHEVAHKEIHSLFAFILQNGSIPFGIVCCEPKTFFNAM